MLFSEDKYNVFAHIVSPTVPLNSFLFSSPGISCSDCWTIISHGGKNIYFVFDLAHLVFRVRVVGPSFHMVAPTYVSCLI